MSQTLSIFDIIIQHDMTFASLNEGSFPFNIILVTISLVSMFLKHFSKIAFKPLRLKFSEETRVLEEEEEEESSTT